MTMRLAVAFGMSAYDVGEYVSAPELTDWLARQRVEPLPDPWYQTGVLAAANAALWRKGRGAAPEDFIPYARAPLPAQSVAGMMEAMASLPMVVIKNGI